MTILVAQSSQDDYVLSGGLKSAAGKLKHVVNSVNYDYTDNLKGVGGQRI